MKQVLTILLILSLFLSIAKAQFTPTFELPNLNGKNGFAIKGNVSDTFGFSSPIGDINNDGINDVLIGFPSNDTNGKNKGAVYVLFGSSEKFKKLIELSDVNGTNGFVIYGVNDSDQLFKSQNGGDINNDGIDDLLIGAFGVDTNGTSSGASYVIFGRDTFPETFDLTTLNGSNGFVINGLYFSSSLGEDVSFINDFNDDGIDDLILGAPSSNGSCYIIFGSTNSFSASFDLTLLNGTNGFTIIGINNGDGLCSSVSSLGDINGDGIVDINIGAKSQGSISNQYYSRNYIIFGSNQGFPSLFDLNQLDGSNGFSIIGIDPDNNENSLSKIYSAGDFNNDGIDDLILGVIYADINTENTGSVYIIFGSKKNWPFSFDLKSLNGENGFKLHGPNELALLGGDTKTIGDVNDDGIDDIIMTTYKADLIFTAPVSYVLFGSEKAFPKTFDLTSLNGNNGFSINNFHNKFLFISQILTSSGAGDINADGIDDIILGGLGSSRNEIDNITGYIIYGRGDMVFKNGFDT